MGQIIYPPPLRRFGNKEFTTASPLHRWFLNDAASPHANYGTAASGLTISNSGSVGGGSITRASRAIIDKGVRFFASATSDRAVIYTANPVAGDIVTGTAFTAMCWLQYFRTTTDQTGAFGKVYDSTLSSFSNPGFQTWGIGINSSSQLQVAMTAGTDGSGTRTGASTSQTVQLGLWYHVGLVYDGATVGIYVNGALAATSARTGNIDNNTAAHSNSGGPYYFGGHPSTNSGANGFQSSVSVEDAMVFSSVITEAEFRHYYNRTMGLFRGRAI